MAWTVREVTARLREELDARNLVVKFDRMRERFVVCERSRQFGGARTVPFTLDDLGNVVAGEARLRPVFDHDEIVYVHEDGAGGFRPLDPNAILQELQRADTHHVNVAGEIMRAVRRKRERADAEFLDEVGQRSKYYRRLVAKAVDEAP